MACSELMVFSADDGGTLFGFSDPDGNTWAVQQLEVRGEQPSSHPSTAAGSGRAANHDHERVTRRPRFDVAVVGGGTAGCVMAARLAAATSGSVVTHLSTITIAEHVSEAIATAP